MNGCHGHGACVLGKCQCHPGFDGDHCSQSKFPFSSAPSFSFASAVRLYFFPFSFFPFHCELVQSNLQKHLRGILAVTMITAGRDKHFLFPFIFSSSSIFSIFFHLLSTFSSASHLSSSPPLCEPPHHLKSISAIPAALMAAWLNFLSLFLFF